eukprot:713716_1
MASPKKDQPPHIKYKKVEIASGSEDNSVIDDTKNNYKATSNPENQNTSPNSTCNNLYKYITHKPLSKLPFLYFCISIIIIILLSIWHFMDSDTPFIIAGIFGILTSVYALNHFRILIHLKIEIDKFHKLNRHFSSENALLSHQVYKLSSECNELQDTHNKLAVINLKTKENNQKFHALQKSLRAVNYDNIKGINSIRNKVTKISSDWNDKVLQRERDVLYKIFERFEHLHGNESEGLSREHFDEFLTMIPSAYKLRFDRLGTFEKLARGKCYIDFKDFGACLDVFATMHVENIDIEFEIQEISDDEKEMDIMPTLVRGRPSYGGRKVHIIRKTQPGMIFDKNELLIQLENGN